MSFTSFVKPHAIPIPKRQTETKENPSQNPQKEKFVSGNVVNLEAKETKERERKESREERRRETNRNKVTSNTFDVSNVKDIIQIDNFIKTMLLSKNDLANLKTEFQELMWIRDNSRDRVDVLKSIKQIDSLRQRTNDIEYGFDYALYLLKSWKVIESYRRLSSPQTSFLKMGETSSKDSSLKRAQLTTEYMRIAKDYIPIQNSNHDGVILCEACQKRCDVSKDEESFMVCNCGTVIEVLDDSPTFKDSERVNMSARYTYTYRGHFIEAMDKFEGKKITANIQNVVEIMREQMRLHSLTEDNVEKNHIYMFLRERKLSDYYADINLIYYLITKIEPPDITIYRNDLLDMLDYVEEAYEAIKGDGKNSPNVYWKLYKQLQLLGYDCKKEDFFCLKTPTKEDNGIQTWSDIIEFLKRKYPEAKTSKRFGEKQLWRHIRTI